MARSKATTSLTISATTRCMAGMYRKGAFLPLAGGRPPRDAVAMHVEILLFDGFDELDALGPWEVFAGLAAARDDVTARLVTLEGAREVRADHGLEGRAHGALSDRPDLLLVPGGGWFDRTPGGVWAAGRAPGRHRRAPRGGQHGGLR